MSVSESSLWLDCAINIPKHLFDLEFYLIISHAYLIMLFDALFFVIKPQKLKIE